MLLEELRLLTARIEDAGLTVDAPLSPGELREVLRVRLDPTVLQGFAARARAGFSDALVSEHNLGPIAVDLELDSARVDGSYHHAYGIAVARLELHPA